MEYSGEERRSSHWHLDKRLNIGHLISTILLATAAFAYISKFDNRLTVLETSYASADRYQQQFNQQVTRELQNISAKLDRLIERLSDK